MGHPSFLSYCTDGPGMGDARRHRLVASGGRQARGVGAERRPRAAAAGRGARRGGGASALRAATRYCSSEQRLQCIEDDHQQRPAAARRCMSSMIHAAAGTAVVSFTTDAECMR